MTLKGARLFIEAALLLFFTGSAARGFLPITSSIRASKVGYQIELSPDDLMTVAGCKPGKTLMDIVAEGNVSRRTAYRYLSYYKELQKMSKDSGLD